MLEVKRSERFDERFESGIEYKASLITVKQTKSETKVK
jgi:hypothetical protein